MRRENSTISRRFAGKFGNLSEKREYRQRGVNATFNGRDYVRLLLTRGKSQITQGTVTRKCEKESKVTQGFSTIVQELTRASQRPDILGSEKEARALTRQWLEYATVCANHADSPQNTKRILNELDTALRHVPYIAGTEKTIADVTLYYVLHSTMVTCSSLRQHATTDKICTHDLYLAENFEPTREGAIHPLVEVVRQRPTGGRAET